MLSNYTTIKKPVLLFMILTFLFIIPGAFTNYLVAVELPSRIYGDIRFQTAVGIRKAGSGSADVMVVSRCDDYAEASLAYKTNTTILMTSSQALDNDTRIEVERLGAGKVLILGDEQTISRSVAFIVYGFKIPDALAAAAYAGVNGYPILLSGSDSLPVETDESNVQHTIVIGGTSVVNKAVMGKLSDATRIVGPNRYAAAVQISEYFNPSGDCCFITTGLDFADRVTRAVLAVRHNSDILLVGYNTPDEVRDYFKRNNVINFTIFGGTAAVSDAVERQLGYSLPNIPTRLKITEVSHARVSLEWNAVAGATAYNIYVSPQEDYVKLATVSQTSYNHTGLESSTTYRYKVSAVNTAGEGELSEEINAVTRRIPGLVTFVLDDGTYNQYSEIYPLFQSKGIPAVWSISTGLISNPSLSPFPFVPATWSQIDEVATRSYPRWEINSHSHTHPRLADVSPAVLQFELSESKRLLDKYGVYSFTYPYYSVNSTVINATANYYQAAYAGGINPGEHYPTGMYSADNLNNINYANYVRANPYALKRVTLFLPDMTEQRWKALINTAYANDGWLIFCLHDVTSSTKNELSRIIDYCQWLGIPIGVTKDGLERYR